jgi:hypothetical protein
MGVDPLSVFIFVASTAFQVQQQSKIRRRQEEAAEKNKGFEFTISGEAAPVPIVYGKNKLGGIAVKHLVAGSYYSGTDNADTTFAINLPNSHRSGTKNEYLHVQYALCQEGISGVQDIKINDLDWDDEDQEFSHSIRTFNNGNQADDIATSNGIPSSNKFTGCAFASATYRLNRDDPQYNGAPAISFLVKGREIRSVNTDNTLGSYSYSNNPAYVLLDYLLSHDFGRGLSVDEVDLASFRHAADVCGTVVTSNRSIAGGVNGGEGQRDLPLYECNITLNPEVTIRDNIELIMETMNMAELTWSSEGKYKLLLEYPTSETQQNALVSADHYFTDDDIIRKNLEIAWPSAAERLNQVTIEYNNEHEDFKSDSVTWPKTYSSAHNTYLSEDNNQPFIKSIRANGVTDPYHAKAMAEAIVRRVRSNLTLSFTVSKKGLGIECGDFIHINSENTGITNEVFRVESIEVNSDFTIKLTCYSFDYSVLAWNVDDDIPYSQKPTYNFSVEPVSNLSYSIGTPAGDPRAIANLSWDSPSDGSFKAIVYYTDNDGGLKRIGETSSDNFLVYPRDEWTNEQNVTFTVKAQTPLGRLSAATSLTTPVVRAPNTPTSFSIKEDLYQTNKASGVKARATILFSQPSGGVEPKDYKIEYYRVEDDSIYKVLNYTNNVSYIFDDVRTGNYYFKITPISWSGYEGSPLSGNKEILGLGATPSDPNGFSIKVTDTVLLLSWDTPSELDVVSGGTSEIRYSNNSFSTAQWSSSQILVKNISGSTTTASLPVLDGCYLLKHVDSTGNECANAAKAINTFVGPDYNTITTINEEPDFTGVKTNCEVDSGGVLRLSPDNSYLVSGYSSVADEYRFSGPIFATDRSMTYIFDNKIDLGSVENIRLTPSMTARVIDNTSVVADYNPVSSIIMFAGDILDSSVNLSLRRTDDDPASPTAEWSDWETFSGGNYYNRAFEFRLLGKATSTAHAIEVSDLSINADKADIQKRGTSASSSSVDTTVTFNSAFYGGVGGADIPYVGVNTVGGSSSDIVNITNISNVDFTYSVYNSGARVNRNVTWQAVGQ